MILLACIFLTSSVKSRALESIANLPITADEFAVAWSTLTTRLENKRRLVQQHLSTLLNLAVVPRESAIDLQHLRDQVQTALSSLHNLGRSDENLWNDILVHLIVQKFDIVTRKAWNVMSTDTNELPLFADLTRFLASRARAFEEFAAGSSSESTGKAAPGSRVHVANCARALVSRVPFVSISSLF